MKADAQIRTIPVIIVSGSDRSADIARAYGLPVAGYLVKPLNVDEYFTPPRSQGAMVSQRDSATKGKRRRIGCAG